MEPSSRLQVVQHQQSVETMLGLLYRAVRHGSERRVLRMPVLRPSQAEPDALAGRVSEHLVAPRGGGDRRDDGQSRDPRCRSDQTRRCAIAPDAYPAARTSMSVASFATRTKGWAVIRARRRSSRSRSGRASRGAAVRSEPELLRRPRTGNPASQGHARWIRFPSRISRRHGSASLCNLVSSVPVKGAHSTLQAQSEACALRNMVQARVRRRRSGPERRKPPARPGSASRVRASVPASSRSRRVRSVGAVSAHDTARQCSPLTSAVHRLTRSRRTPRPVPWSYRSSSAGSWCWRDRRLPSVVVHDALLRSRS